MVKYEEKSTCLKSMKKAFRYRPTLEILSLESYKKEYLPFTCSICLVKSEITLPPPLFFSQKY